MEGSLTALKVKEIMPVAPANLPLLASGLMCPHNRLQVRAPQDRD